MSLTTRAASWSARMAIFQAKLLRIHICPRLVLHRPQCVFPSIPSHRFLLFSKLLTWTTQPCLVQRRYLQHQPPPLPLDVPRFPQLEHHLQSHGKDGQPHLHPRSRAQLRPHRRQASWRRWRPSRRLRHHSPRTLLRHRRCPRHQDQGDSQERRYPLGRNLCHGRDFVQAW